jgi:hypothetical protein
MIAIYFHPEAYSISGPRLMGRNAAGESFLRGFVRHTSDIRPQTEEERQKIRERGRKYGD